MAGLMLFAGLAMGITGGISNAQNYCKYEKKIKKVIEETNQVIQKSQKVYDNIEIVDNSVLSDILTLSQAAQASSNDLLTLRQQYIDQMRKYQLVALMVVVAVFMLLLAKKLKII